MSERWRDDVKRLRAEADPDKRAGLKKQLPAFIPAGVFTERTADGLQEHSGFICIDIDAKDNADVADFDRLKEYMHQVPHVAYCGRSVGGKGFFCLIPIADPARHRDYFQAIGEDFERCGITVDWHCSDVGRLRFVSYDPAPYINTGAKVYDYISPEMGCSKARMFGRELTGSEAEARFLFVLQWIEEHGMDITGDYGQWFKILCGIASAFGESGRDYAHRVSRYADCYNYGETERQYSEILKHKYKYTIGTFFYFARKKMGADLYYSIKGIHDFDKLVKEEKV